MQWANQHLASMFSKGKFDKSSISKAINHFEARLSIASRENDELAALFSSMEECYKVFDAASAGAFPRINDKEEIIRNHVRIRNSRIRRSYMNVLGFRAVLWALLLAW